MQDPLLNSRLNFFFLIYSVVALSVTFIAHVALYFGFNTSTAAPTVWTLLQLSIPFTGIGVVFCFRHPPIWTQETRNLHSPVYLWLSILFPLFLFYAVFCFFYYSFALDHGFLDFRDGHDVLVNRNKIVKILTANELPKYQSYEARFYSGYWMFCNTVLCTMAFINFKCGMEDKVEKNKRVMDASSEYDVERRALYGERPGFRISELQISPTQTVPWHLHTNIDDTFYVVAGKIRLFIREPHENIRLAPGDSYCVKAGRPHLVTNEGDTSATFVILQGIGEYDYVPFSLD